MQNYDDFYFVFVNIFAIVVPDVQNVKLQQY
jgi:hypothetical protein